MAELTINADEIAAALRKHVEGFTPTIEQRAGRAGCSRSATASRASPGLPDAAVNELLEFEGGTLGLALNLDEDSIGAVVLGEADDVEEGQHGQGDRPHPLGPGRRRAARPGRERARRQPIDGKGPIASDDAAPPRGPGARHRRPQAGARAAADRHQGHRRDDARSAGASAS